MEYYGQIIVLETNHSGVDGMNSRIGNADGEGSMKLDWDGRQTDEGERKTPWLLILIIWVLKRQSLTDIMHFSVL